MGAIYCEIPFLREAGPVLLCAGALPLLATFSSNPHMKNSSKLFLIGALTTASGSLHAQTTGFNQTAAGPWDYNDTANWVGGNINGIWDSSLTLAAAQTVTFGTDTALGTGLDFRYAGSQNLTLRANGTGPSTITLAGDIMVGTASANRTITIGSTTANQNLNVNLGGATRTFSVGGISATDSIRTLTFQNNVSNGGLIVNGGGNVNLNGGANTLSGLRIQNSAFRLNGNSGANSSTTVSGALTIDGAASSIASNTTHLGGIATITLTPNAARNISLSASSLVRENTGVVFFRGNNLGGTLGANGVSNITFGTGPSLVGGNGAAGTTNMSILSWAIGATTAGGSADSFITYDSVNGIRALTASEFVNYADGYSGSVTGTDNNSRIASGATVNFTGNNTVNSLFVGGAAASTLTGDGSLTVTSGAVFVQNASTIGVNLNFGSSEGILGAAQGVTSTVSGVIAGSGGLTVYQASANTSTFNSGNSVNFTNAATFTGDFTVNSRASVTDANFLAHGARSGDTIINGTLYLNGNGGGAGYTMNGLYGNGHLFKSVSNAATIRIGDNDSDGNFTGIIGQFGSATVQKIGLGTQIFGGASTYGGGTQVIAGTLLLTNTEGSATGTGSVSVSAGATLGGTGIASGSTTLAAGAKLSPGADAGLTGNLTFSNGLNLSASSNDTGAYLFTLDTLASSDKITLTSGTDFALNVGTLDVSDFTFTTTGNFTTGAYVLFNANSAIAGSIGIADTYDFGGGLTGTLSIDTINNDVLLTVVPEPSAALLGGFGVACLLWRGRRCRK
jgi:fibronectin-binding autotransporter adhesin